MKLKKPMDLKFNLGLLKDEVIFGSLYFYGFILVLMSIFGLNLIGPGIVFTIWLYIYGNIYKNETNDIIKYVLFFVFIIFLNKLLEAPYFSEPPNSTFIRWIFFLAFFDLFFIDKNLIVTEKNKIKIHGFNAQKRKWKFVSSTIFLSVIFGLFINYEGGYTKKEFEKEFYYDYIDNSDGTVTHEKSGLIWQRCSVGQVWEKNTCEGDAQNFTWNEAIKFFINNNDGWRLPTNAEMINLVNCSDNNYEKYGEGVYRICATNRFTSFSITVSPTINSIVFPYTPQGFFWSSAENDKKAWGIGFKTGRYGMHDKDDKGYIRLVRNIGTTANLLTE